MEVGLSDRCLSHGSFVWLACPHRGVELTTQKVRQAITQAVGRPRVLSLGEGRGALWLDRNQWNTLEMEENLSKCLSEDNVLVNSLHNQNFGPLFELSLGMKNKEKIVFFLVPAGIRATRGGSRQRRGGSRLCEVPSTFQLTCFLLFWPHRGCWSPKG